MSIAAVFPQPAIQQYRPGRAIVGVCGKQAVLKQFRHSAGARLLSDSTWIKQISFRGTPFASIL